MAGKPVTVKNFIHPHHSRTPWTQPKLKNTRRIIASLVVLLLSVTAILSGMTWMSLQSKLSARAMEVPSIQNNITEPMEYKPIDPNDGRPLDILLLGQDTRGGDAENAEIGGHDPNDKDNHQADTAMVVHISAARDSVDVISLPRDSIVDQPECATTNGIAPARANVMLNSTFAYGWKYGGDLPSAVSCELATVNQATGLDITQTVVVDFAGMMKMIDAIDGVDICVPARVDDPYTNLKLEPGVHKLNGLDATQYARVRHGVDGADGSDIMRTVRQQTVVKALISQALSSGTLSNPTRLYSLGVSVIDSLNLSKGLASAPTLVGLAYSLRRLNMNEIQTRTVPVVPWSQDPNRVVWSDDADEIWEALRNDRPLGMGADVTDDQKLDGNADAGDPDSGDPGTDDALPSDGSYVNKDVEASGTNDQADLDSHSGEVKGNTSDDVASADGFAMDDALGLLKNPETGELRDPTTGGRVDPQTGYVYDPKTGGVVGLAYQYVNETICKVK